MVRARTPPFYEHPSTDTRLGTSIIDVIQPAVDEATSGSRTEENNQMIHLLLDIKQELKEQTELLREAIL